MLSVLIIVIITVLSTLTLIALHFKSIALHGCFQGCLLAKQFFYLEKSTTKIDNINTLAECK